MSMMPFTFNKMSIRWPIFQGGMGIGVSGFLLAGTVSKEGGLGVISSAGLDRVVGERLGRVFSAREAASVEVSEAKKIAGSNPVGINIMVAAVNQYEDSVLGAMNGGVDVIISGAGLPIKLPGIVAQHPRKDQVALIPIVSSGRALNIIIKKWARFGRVPDAVVVEGPLAGGHIGWSKTEEAMSEQNCLENLVLDVLAVASEFNIPVIAAGGIYDSSDIVKYLEMGCAAVQMGTRFLATHESGASAAFKAEIVNCKEEDILLAKTPGSPCGLLFRVIQTSPFYQQALKKERLPQCNKGYVLIDGKCPAKDSQDSFCICNGLLASCSSRPKEKELYTIGARGHEITKIISVSELMQELIIA